jgi:hypothetical protein
MTKYKFKIILKLFCATFFCFAFNREIKNLNTIINEFHNKFKPNSKSVRLDGVYTLLSYEDTLNNSNIYYNPFINQYYNDAIAFFDNGLCINPVDRIAYTDSVSLINAFNRKTKEKNMGGVYYTENGKIKIIQLTSFNIGGGRIRSEYVIFEGTIINKDTITNFKIIPPYPKLHGGFMNHNKYIKKGETLIFKNFPLKIKYDSTNFKVNNYLEIDKQ